MTSDSHLARAVEDTEAGGPHMARHVGRVRRVADEPFSPRRRVRPGGGVRGGPVGAVPVRMYHYDANALAPTWSAFSL